MSKEAFETKETVPENFPLFPFSYEYAKERDSEIEKNGGAAHYVHDWINSGNANIQCAKAIDEAMQQTSVGGVFRYGRQAVEELCERFTSQRVLSVLANSVLQPRENEVSMFFSPEVIKWANQDPTATMWLNEKPMPNENNAPAASFIVPTKELEVNAFIRHVYMPYVLDRGEFFMEKGQELLNNDVNLSEFHTGMENYLKEKELNAIHKSDAMPLISDYPFYGKEYNYARQADQLETSKGILAHNVDDWCASRRANIACKDAVDRALTDNYNWNTTTADKLNEVARLCEQFTFKRVNFILANSVLQNELYNGGTPDTLTTLDDFDIDKRVIDEVHDWAIKQPDVGFLIDEEKMGSDKYPPAYYYALDRQGEVTDFIHSAFIPYNEKIETYCFDEEEKTGEYPTDLKEIHKALGLTDTSYDYEHKENNKRVNAGYTITDSMHVGERTEIVIGQRDSQVTPFVTWVCSNGDNYNGGHYLDTRKQAEADFLERVGKYLEIDIKVPHEYYDEKTKTEKAKQAIVWDDNPVNKKEQGEVTGRDNAQPRSKLKQHEEMER